MTSAKGPLPASKCKTTHENASEDKRGLAEDRFATDPIAGFFHRFAFYEIDLAAEIVFDGVGKHDQKV